MRIHLKFQKRKNQDVLLIIVNQKEAHLHQEEGGLSLLLVIYTNLLCIKIKIHFILKVKFILGLC